MGAPSQEITDLSQDVFQTVAKSIGSFSNQKATDTFRGWLRTITRSRVVDWQRRNRGKPIATGGTTAQAFFAKQPFESASPKSADEDQLAMENLLTQQMYVRALKIIQRHFQETTWRAFCRVVIDGLSPQEVAEELEMQPGAVRVAKSRVLHRLRAELGDLVEAAIPTHTEGEEGKDEG